VLSVAESRCLPSLLCQRFLQTSCTSGVFLCRRHRLAVRLVRTLWIFTAGAANAPVVHGF
jgi:hypothetical protein